MDARFAVSTFRRVFEVTPTRDVLDLEVLTAGLLRFELKPKLDKAVERDIARIERAYQAIESDERLGGRRWSIMRRAQRADPANGARRAYEKLLANARGRAKTDLRLWAPALYPADSRRESDNVVSLSCLVLDYDGGESIERASAHWGGWYRIVHSTWSYRPGTPKFRLCLPLARPVLAEDWREFWAWAAERSNLKSDPALKSPGSTFALPATPGASAPRVAFVERGPLFDPIHHGPLRRCAPPPPSIPEAPVSHFRGDPSLRFIDAPRASFEPEEDEFDLFPTSEDPDSEWELF